MQHPIPETALWIDDPAPWSLRGLVLAGAVWNVIAAVLRVDERSDSM